MPPAVSSDQSTADLTRHCAAVSDGVAAVLAAAGVTATVCVRGHQLRSRRFVAAHLTKATVTCLVSGKPRPLCDAEREALREPLLAAGADVAIHLPTSMIRSPSFNHTRYGFVYPPSRLTPEQQGEAGDAMASRVRGDITTRVE